MRTKKDVAEYFNGIGEPSEPKRLTLITELKDRFDEKALWKIIFSLDDSTINDLFDALNEELHDAPNR